MSVARSGLRCFSFRSRGCVLRCASHLPWLPSLRAFGAHWIFMATKNRGRRRNVQEACAQLVFRRLRAALFSLLSRAAKRRRKVARGKREARGPWINTKIIAGPEGR